jgi:hypothetical protein
MRTFGLFMVVPMWLLGSVPACAQAVVFDSYADYVAEQGREAGEFVDAFPVLGRFTFEFEQDGRRQRVRGQDIWGFTYRGVLFRIHHHAAMPMRLMARGEVCYYENGFAHLDMQRDRKEAGFYEHGYQACLSTDLEAPMVPASFSEEEAPPEATAFCTARPALRHLCGCIGAGQDIGRTRQCVVDYEVAMEEVREAERSSFHE